jgi:hypothetical protein
MKEARCQNVEMKAEEGHICTDTERQQEDQKIEGRGCMKETR